MTMNVDTNEPKTAYSERWITDTAWVSGLTGALMTVFCSYYYSTMHVLNDGLYLFGWKIGHNKYETGLYALLIITLSMVCVEVVRLYFWNPKIQLQRSPLLEQKQYKAFVMECLRVFALNGLLLGIAVAIYKCVPQYPAWGLFMDVVWVGYLILGLPYVLVTRAYQYSAEADKTDYPNLVSKSLWFLFSLVPGQSAVRPKFGFPERKTALGLLVKVFFCPLITVFFFDNFPNLVNNMDYIFGGLPGTIMSGEYTHKRFNADVVNISKALIFSIDVALAWCGYIISSRWLDNQTQSAETTALGWFVCLISYPPFRMIGLYFMWPSESAIMKIDSLWLVSFFSVLSILSFFVYSSATIFFGVRFSNLTNRGIIRTGPFAIVRHPAYASKNFSWWCVIFPAIILNMDSTGLALIPVFIVGLCMQSWIYYLRAITEERHLSADPQYIEYCKHVKYRFIPGII